MKYPNYSDAQIEKRYTDAREIYDDFGINTDTVLRKLDKIRISMHCWQGDDVGGFECREDKTLTGGILATGSRPGKARNADELRQDAEKAFSLIPGRHRFNLHAIYLETGGRFVDRNEIEPEHFVRWVDWAKSLKIKLDFNPTFFSHPKSASGFTLSSPDKAIRKFWIEHAKRCRFIAEYFSKELNSVVINNTWIPDGFKDIAMACMVIGIARAILIVLQEGCIIDTVVYYASLPLSAVPTWLSGVAMLCVQTVISFFIGSGSGQAATSMPIMAPLADILGFSRETAVLAFQMSDGLTNSLWPTGMTAVMCSLAGIKIEKWWKWFVPVFICLFITECILMVIAVPFSFWLTRSLSPVLARKHITIFKFLKKLFDEFKNSYVQSGSNQVI